MLEIHRRIIHLLLLSTAILGFHHRAKQNHARDSSFRLQPWEQIPVVSDLGGDQEPRFTDLEQNGLEADDAGIRGNLLGSELESPQENDVADHSLRIRTPRASPKSVKNVLGRLPQWVAEQFSSVDITDSSEITSGFARLTGTAEGVQIEAASVVDALYAAHAYLREFCGTMVTWEGENVQKTGECRRPDEFERTYNSPKVRYFGNPLTFSYSFAWWDWSKWERMIDWIALSGFNMMLVPVGQEAIWAELWTEMGVSEEELQKWFTGPAFLPWHRSGDVQGLGGASLNSEYLSSQQELARKIMRRLSQLGIVPVLPTFAGFVPQEFARKNDHLRFIKNGLNSTHSFSLHPQEPEFVKIAKIFIEKQAAVFGDVTSVYSAEPFTKTHPEHLTNEDISSMASAVFKGCKQGNSKCIWLLQSSSFSSMSKTSVHSLLSVVPVGRLIVLDLEAEKQPLYQEMNHFFGHLFVFGLCHNKGGNAQMRGNLGRLHEDYRSALVSSPSMIGMGVTTEAINQNYVVYAFFIDLAWTDNKKELDPRPWIHGYASARYVSSSPAHQRVQNRAWDLLLSSFYTQMDFPRSRFDPEMNTVPTEQEYRRELFLYDRPSMEDSHRIRYWFNSSLIDKVATAFSTLNRTFASNELFKQDFSDVMREVIQRKLADTIQSAIFLSFGTTRQEKRMLRDRCVDLQTLFDDLDRNERRVLREELLMARNAATSRPMADAFEVQEKILLTQWTGTGRQLGGLMRKFHARRWGVFCRYLQGGFRFSKKKLDGLMEAEVEMPFVQM